MDSSLGVSRSGGGASSSSTVGHMMMMHHGGEGGAAPQHEGPGPGLMLDESVHGANLFAAMFRSEPHARA